MQIGRYNLLEKLGEGSMSVVYKAYDPKINRVLAIKFLRDERCQNDDYRARFVREAKAVGTLSHSNIVTIYDVGEIEHRPYIAMEWIEGTPLNVAMKSGVKFDVATTIRLGIQIAEALNYAHERGIVHRDVKPSNILLLKSNTECKIADFGIAHIDAQEVTYQTQVGEMLGTPQYMSPEQVLGKKVDARSDLFSLGVILYQLFSGKKPFDAPSVANVLFKIATENPQPIGQIAPQLPPQVKQAVDRLLKKAPEKRFQSGKELAEQFNRILFAVENQGLSTHKLATTGKSASVTALIGSVIAGAITAAFYVETQSLTQSFMQQHGASVTQLVSYQIAEPLLAQDWPSVELLAHDIAEKQQYRYLYVLDHTGVVRGGSDANVNGKPLSEQNAQNAGMRDQASNDGENSDFQSPIQFGNQTIGTIRVGFDTSALLDARSSYTLLIGILSSIGLLLAGVLLWPRNRVESSADTKPRLNPSTSA